MKSYHPIPFKILVCRVAEVVVYFPPVAAIAVRFLVKSIVLKADF